MKVNYLECIVNPSQAKKLKELGYSGETEFYYEGLKAEKTSQKVRGDVKTHKNWELRDEEYSAPRVVDIVNWAFESQNMLIHFSYNYTSNNSDRNSWRPVIESNYGVESVPVFTDIVTAIDLLIDKLDQMIYIPKTPSHISKGTYTWNHVVNSFPIKH